MSQCVTNFVTNVTIPVTLSRNVVPSSVPDTLRSLYGPGLAAVASAGLASQPLSASIQARPVPRAAPASEHKPHNCFLRPRSQPEPGEPLTEFYSLTILTMMSDSQLRLMSKYYDTEAVLRTLCHSVLLLRHQLWALCISGWSLGLLVTGAQCSLNVNTGPGCDLTSPDIMTSPLPCPLYPAIQATISGVGGVHLGA
mgnify:CR=1 FL=1